MTKKLVWNRVAYPGKFHHPVGGAFEMSTEGTFGSIIDAFSRRKAAIPVDFDHKIESSDTTGNGDKIASGWCHALELRGTDLYAGIEWTEKAKQLIAANHYRYLSPAIVFNGKDNSGNVVPARLSSIGLVNRPFLANLDPVLASDVTTSFLCSELSDLDRAAIAVNDSDESELLPMSEHTMLRDEAVRIAVAPLSLQLHDAEVKLADAETLAAVAEARVAALEARVALMADEQITARVEDAFLTYQKSKGLTLHSKIGMRLLYEHGGVEAFDREYPKLSPAKSVLLRTLTDQDPSNGITHSNVKTVPHLSQIIADVKAQNPTADWDRQFDIALATQTRLMAESAGVMVH